jgi:hypothetical protein
MQVTFIPLRIMVQSSNANFFMEALLFPCLKTRSGRFMDVDNVKLMNYGMLFEFWGITTSICMMEDGWRICCYVMLRTSFILVVRNEYSILAMETDGAIVEPPSDGVKNNFVIYRSEVRLLSPQGNL